MELDELKRKIDFVGGQYLHWRMFDKVGIKLTIKSVKTETIKNMRTFKDEEKKVMYFEEIDKGLVLGAKCNRLAIMTLGSDMKGKKITVYGDPTVKFGKETVGALRLRT